MRGAMLLCALAMAIAIGILRGWVLSYLWLWFLVPLGAVQISVAHAMGLSLLVSLFSSHGMTERAKEGADALKWVFGKLIGHAASALIFLGFGYILAGVMA